MTPYGDGLPPSVRIANDLLTQRALAEGLSERASVQLSDTPGTRSAPRQYLYASSPRFASQRVRGRRRRASGPVTRRKRAAAHLPMWRIGALRVVFALLAICFWLAMVTLCADVLDSRLSLLTDAAIIGLMVTCAVLIVVGVLPACFRWLSWHVIEWR